MKAKFLFAKVRDLGQAKFTFVYGHLNCWLNLLRNSNICSEICLLQENDSCDDIGTKYRNRVTTPLVHGPHMYLIA